MRNKKAFGALIKYVSQTYEQNFNRVISAYGLTMSQSHVLMYLAKNSGRPIYQKDIEEAFNLTHPTVNGLITRLEDKGFVETRTSDFDRRCKHIVQTEKADKIISLVRQSFDEVDDIIVNCLDEEEKSEILRLLQKIIDNIPADKAPRHFGHRRECDK